VRRDGVKRTVILLLVLSTLIGSGWAKEEAPVTAKDSPKLREAYETFVLGVKNPASVKNNEGNLFLIKGMYDEAIAKYREALALDPTSTLIINNLSWALIMTGQYEEAVGELKRSIALDAKNPSTNFYLGVAYWRLSDPKAAKPYLEKAVSLDPSHPYSHYYLSKVYRSEGNLKSAIAEGELAAYILGNVWNPDVALYLGDLYGEAEMFQKAVAQYEKLVSEEDYAFEANYGLGIAYGKFKDYKKAETYLLRALDLNDDDPMVYYALGKLYSQDDKRLKKALGYAEDALKREPTNPRFLYLVGWVYYRMGDERKALEFMKKALAADPENGAYRSQVRILEEELSNEGER
jgi:tetratricopeptide (TPR) repeat protein